MARLDDLELIIKVNPNEALAGLANVQDESDKLRQQLEQAISVDVSGIGLEALADGANNAASKLGETEQAAATLGAANIGDAGLSGLADAADASANAIGNAAGAASGLKGEAESAGAAASNAAQEAESAVRQAAGAIEEATDDAGSFVAVFEDFAAKQLDSAVGGFAGFFDSAIERATAAEQTFLGLEATIERTGGRAGVSAQEVVRFADQLADATLTSQGAVVRSADTLLSFRNINRDVFFEAISLAQDLAAQYDSDLEETIIQVAEALNALELSGLGDAATNLESNAALVEQIELLKERGDVAAAQRLIVDELNVLYGGQGEAVAQGLAGATDTFGENIADIQGAFGRAFLEPFTEFTNSLAAIQPDLIELAKILGETAGGGLQLLAQAAKFASENITLLQAAIVVLIARYAAVQAINLVISILNITTALQAQAIATFGAATATTTLATGLGVAKAAMASFIATALPLAALAAAVVGVKVAIDALGTAAANVDLAGFIAGADADLDSTFAAANRTANAIDELNEARAAGRSISAEELDDAERLRQANELRVEQLRQQLSVLEAQRPANEDQAAAIANLRSQYESGITALESQNAKLQEAISLTEELANPGDIGGAFADAIGGDAADALVTARVDAVRRANEAAQREIELAQTEEIAAIRQSQAERVISAEQAEEQIAAVRARARESELGAIAEQQAQIQTLVNDGAIADADAAQQLADLEQRAATIRLEQIDAEIAAQDRLRQAESERIQQTADLQRSRSELAIAATERETAAIDRQLSLSRAQGDLVQAQIGLRQARLETALAEAEAEGNINEVASLREDIRETESDAIAAQFDARQQQLELEQQQAAIALEREAINARIATLDAEAAIQQAILNDANAAELEILNNQLALRQQQQDLVAAQQSSQDQLNATLQETLNTERAIAEEQSRAAEAAADREQEASASSSAGVSGSPGSSQLLGSLSGSQITQNQQARSQLSDILNRGGGLQDLFRLARSNDFGALAASQAGAAGQSALELARIAELGGSRDARSLAADADAAARAGDRKNLNRALDRISSLAEALVRQPRSITLNGSDSGRLGNALGQINQAAATAGGF